MVLTAGIMGWPDGEVCQATMFNHQHQRPRVILDIKPVANVLTVAVNRQRFAALRSALTSALDPKRTSRNAIIGAAHRRATDRLVVLRVGGVHVT
jgi:hypothetical protein